MKKYCIFSLLCILVTSCGGEQIYNYSRVSKSTDGQKSTPAKVEMIESTGEIGTSSTVPTLQN